MDLYEVAEKMVTRTHLKAQTTVGDSLAERVFLLYVERMLSLLQDTLTLIRKEDVVSSSILLRSALECYVDLYNITLNTNYTLVLRAMLLESRSSIFHYKTKPQYDSLLEELGEEETRKMGKDLARELTSCIKEATEHFPILRFQTRNLNIHNRFVMAGLEENYHTYYTWLSMQAHNALEPLLIGEKMRHAGSSMDEAQDSMVQAAILHLAIELLVDSLKCMEKLFGHDQTYTQDILTLLESSQQNDPLLPLVSS